MSENSILNAAIALIENRPKDAREMLRAPGQSGNVFAVHSRLNNAIVKREKAAQQTVLKDIIMKTLRIDTECVVDSDGILNWTDKEREAFFFGVAEVERIIDDAIAKLET